jgi:hypothetical protein
MVNDLDTMIVKMVAKMNEKKKKMKAGPVEIMHRIILVILVNTFYHTSNQSYSLQYVLNLVPYVINSHEPV